MNDDRDKMIFFIRVDDSNSITARAEIFNDGTAAAHAGSVETVILKFRKNMDQKFLRFKKIKKSKYGGYG